MTREHHPAQERQACTVANAMTLMAMNGCLDAHQVIRRGNGTLGEDLGGCVSVSTVRVRYAHVGQDLAYVAVFAEDTSEAQEDGPQDADSHPEIPVGPLPIHSGECVDLIIPNKETLTFILFAKE